ncbi:MAG: type I 3-dehydroquinate dehydratase [Verrucomicrobia bacterium]|nr:type I 3-dehydroquinate dehydratase [Verrucomicrobiota bacterium]
MPHTKISLLAGRAWVVGSLGSAAALRAADGVDLLQVCDIAEIRLDLLQADGVAAQREHWRHLAGIPLLFTARRMDEGGASDLDAAQRSDLLHAALEDAAFLDVEVASLATMPEILAEAARRGVPWIASFHDFEKLPDSAVLAAVAQQARVAGAAAFKVAARLHSLTEVVRLAEFQLSTQGLPVATMGMGVLAPVSRLLCAQCGSVLNYGYLGDTPTAPGQWDCGLLKQAISRLAPWRGHAVRHP